MGTFNVEATTDLLNKFVDDLEAIEDNEVDLVDLISLLSAVILIYLEKFESETKDPGLRTYLLDIFKKE